MSATRVQNQNKIKNTLKVNSPSPPAQKKRTGEKNDEVTIRKKYLKRRVKCKNLDSRLAIALPQVPPLSVSLSASLPTSKQVLPVTSAGPRRVCGKTRDGALCDTALLTALAVLA